MTEPRFTILVVEDDRHTRTFLADNLAADGYEPIAAENAREAVRLIETRYPDLAIVDLTLPDRDGPNGPDCAPLLASQSAGQRQLQGGQCGGQPQRGETGFGDHFAATSFSICGGI